jgi:hypothetical protein
MRVADKINEDKDIVSNLDISRAQSFSINNIEDNINHENEHDMTNPLNSHNPKSKNARHKFDFKFNKGN